MALHEDVAAMREGALPLPAYDRHMGFTLMAEDGIALAVDVDDRFANPTGVVHGGVVMGLMDSAMGLAVCSQVPPGSVATNVETHNRFLRAVRAGPLVARPHVIRAGRRVVVMGCTVTDGEGREVAVASSTFLVLPEGALGE